MKQPQNKDAAILLENSDDVCHASVLIEMLCQEHELCKQLIRNYAAELEALPKGSLCKKVIGESSYLYHSTASDDSKTGFSQKYIMSADAGLAEGLKRRAVLKRSLPWLKKNDLAIRRFLRHYLTFDPSVVEQSLPEAYSGIEQRVNTEQWAVKSLGGSDQIKRIPK